jgi:hypothetical protein
MNDNPWMRGCLTALAVALVLGLLRRAGPRAGGLAAAIPVTSVPALAWMAWEQGPDFAAASATAALLATGMTGVFALLYALLARQRRAAVALIGAAAPALMLTVAVSGLGRHLAWSLCGATLLVLSCLMAMPAAASVQRRSAHWRRDLMLTMAVSGLVTTAISLIAPRVPALLCGLVAAIPVIGMCTTVSVHARGGSPAVTQFLEAYLRGLLAKIVFLGVLAGLLPLLGAGLPWLLAAACGIAAVLALPLLRLGPSTRPALALAALPVSRGPGGLLR